MGRGGEAPPVLKHIGASAAIGDRADAAGFMNGNIKPGSYVQGATMLLSVAGYFLNPAPLW